MFTTTVTALFQYEIPKFHPFSFSFFAYILQFSKDIIQLEASKGAFGALRSDGLVVTWGDVRCGGEAAVRESGAVWQPD